MPNQMWLSWCTNEKKLMIDYQEFFLIQMMCLFIKYKNAQCIYMHAQSSVNSIHIILKMRLYLKKSTFLNHTWSMVCVTQFNKHFIVHFAFHYLPY